MFVRPPQKCMIKKSDSYPKLLGVYKKKFALQTTNAIAQPIRRTILSALVTICLHVKK